MFLFVNCLSFGYFYFYYFLVLNLLLVRMTLMVVGRGFFVTLVAMATTARWGTMVMTRMMIWDVLSKWLFIRDKENRGMKYHCKAFVWRKKINISTSSINSLISFDDVAHMSTLATHWKLTKLWNTKIFRFYWQITNFLHCKRWR